MIVRTPRLHRSCGFLVTSDGTFYFCLHEMEALFDVPKIRAYWGEVNDQQWKDKSGLRVKVRLTIGTPQCLFSGRTYILCVGLESILRKFGCVPDGPAKTIYFRLLYEE